jgi:hypothetical protein
MERRTKGLSHLPERDYKSPGGEIWSVSSNTRTPAFFSRLQPMKQRVVFIAPLILASHLHIYALGFQSLADEARCGCWQLALWYSFWQRRG